MKSINRTTALKTATAAAEQAGPLLRRNLTAIKKINESSQHDIKLDLDVRCQKLIERSLQKDFPGVAVLGEEGISGDPEAEARWVVDPIDGTVNFTYGIPHACVSIALQIRGLENEFETVAGVVYDPFANEMFSAVKGGPARLNGRRIHVSQRAKLNETIISLGFAKSTDRLETMLPVFNRLVRQARKVRIMGAAALAVVYVASGRFDVYLEGGIRLWDIAAGGLILECAGGEFWRRPIAGDYAYEMVASNGLLRRKLGPGFWTAKASKKP